MFERDAMGELEWSVKRRDECQEQKRQFWFLLL